MRRRTLLALAAAGTAFAAWPVVAKVLLPTIEVFKNPACGCCGAWVDHLKTSGFSVKVHETPDTSPIRKRHGIPDEFGSCHTGVIAGYAIEGHVPALDIKRLLTQMPVAAGLSVPGMPVGAPGMETGARRDPFQVLLIHKVGRSSVFASYPKT